MFTPGRVVNRGLREGDAIARTDLDLDPDSEPAPPYPPLYLEGLRLFNRGEFWECHEALEELWLPLDGGAKDFYQALIQTAGAFHHVTQTGRLGAARRLFELALEKLAAYADRERYGGLDIAQLGARIARARDEAAAVERGERASFEPELVFEIGPDEAAPSPRPSPRGGEGEEAG